MTYFDTLSEGLRKSDLVELVLPMISIDEYSSKIDNGQSIVVGFFVSDKDAADDLARFIEKGSIDVLDTDVSPVPTPEGYFITFIEFLRNSSFPERLLAILDSATNLTEVKTWQFKPYMTPNIIDVTEESIKEHISLEPDPTADEKLAIKQGIKTIKQEVDDIKDELAEARSFILDSDLLNAKINSKYVVFESNNKKLQFKFAGFGEMQKLMHELQITNKPFKLNESSLSFCNNLTSMLGSGWSAADIDNYIIIANNNYNDVMALRKI
jgi:hypothetical protein